MFRRGPRESERSIRRPNRGPRPFSGQTTKVWFNMSWRACCRDTAVGRPHRGPPRPPADSRSSRQSVHMTPTTPRRRPLRRLRFHRSEGRWWRRFPRLAGFRGAPTGRPRGMRHALEPKGLCRTRCRPNSGSRTALRPGVHGRTPNPSPISNGGSSETSCLPRSNECPLYGSERSCGWWGSRASRSKRPASGLGFSKRPPRRCSNRVWRCFRSLLEIGSALDTERVPSTLEKLRDLRQRRAIALLYGDRIEPEQAREALRMGSAEFRRLHHDALRTIRAVVVDRPRAVSFGRE